MQTVKIYTNPKTGGTEVSIDGIRLNRVVSAAYVQSFDTSPLFKFDIDGYPDIEMEIENVSIQFQFTPQTVREAAGALRHSFLTDKELYNALQASVASALKELPKESNLEDVAKAVADRIIGEE